MLFITPEKLKEYENQADAAGFSFDQMMRAAGKGLAEVIHARWQNLPKKIVTGLIGGGKNGADTLIALTHLHSLGWIPYAIKMSPSALPEWVVEEYKKTGRLLEDYQESHHLLEIINESSLILDGIIGTGFTPPLQSELSEKMKFLKTHCQAKTVIAVDCPSGTDCLSGTVEQSTLNADLTVCMEGVKTGLMEFPAFEYTGEICTVDVGILKRLHRKLDVEDLVIDKSFVTRVLPERKRDSHKGSFGTVLVCGGSVNYPGAPVFAARAAYRIGAGLVKTAVPERIYDIAAGQCLESTWIVLDDERGVISESAAKVIKKDLNKISCLAIGPGMGSEETTFRFLKESLTNSEGNGNLSGVGFLQNQNSLKTTKPDSFCPVVIDADGLRLLAKMPDWFSTIKHKLVLTPHPGEMSELTGLPIDEIQKNRIEICRRFAAEWHQVVVLKGALSVVASPDGRVGICPIASSALAKAGSGDVLTGLIAGLIAQGVDLFYATCAGVWIHGSAGLIAASKSGNERSIGIDDILDFIPNAINQ